MIEYSVFFAPEAEDQLVALYRFIADAGAPDIAKRYTDAVINFCESLNSFPIRGVVRDDLRPGLRITNYKKRLVVAFAIDSVTKRISILGLYYGGQDYEGILRETSEPYSPPST